MQSSCRMPKTVITFLALAFVGAAIAFGALYTQFVSMDLQRITLTEYLQKDVTLFVWWQAVVAPFVVGIGYVVTAIIGIRFKPGSQSTVLILLACFAVSILLCFAHAGFGIMASVSLLAMSFGPLYAALRQRRRGGTA